MKKKDIVYAALAAIILLVAGVIAVTQLAPQKGSPAKANEVEVVRAFTSNFDATALTQIDDSAQVRDFGITFDLTAGLGNPALFGK